MDLPAATDVLTWVTMGGGASIRLIVRDERGAEYPRTSFRVTDSQGRPVRVVYTPVSAGALPPDPEREWSIAWFADRFEDVPGRGSIGLEPGSWRIELRRPDDETQVIPVRTYVDMVTCIDVSPPSG